MKKGFTLIELAIVLVIISIVIGAIIGSRDLIESAKLNGIISDFKKYESAFNAFKEKYGAIPGDMPDAESVFTVPDTGCPGYYNGNGDNAINSFSSNYEQAFVFDMLSKAGLVDFKPNQQSINCTSISASSYTPGYVFPESTVKNSGFFLYMDTSSPEGILELATYAEESRAPYGGLVKPSEALSIDKKIDDGIAESGKFYGRSAEDVGLTCISGGLYVSDSEASGAKSCILRYIVDNY